MISLNEILKYYPEELRKFKKFVLREYLQYKILEIIFESPFANKLSFLGDTCLRIVHNNTRFSKDIDFENFNLSIANFDAIADIIQKKLEKQGYTVEIKNVFAGAYHCYIKFPKLLYNERLSGYIEQKILIQLDTEPHHFEYTPDKYILNKFDVFTSINVTPPDILLSQKIYALINRKRKKGRDFFDIVLLFKTNRPNYAYLEQKLNISNDKQLKHKLMEELHSIDLQEMVKDVEAFLFYPDERKKIELFKQFIDQIL